MRIPLFAALLVALLLPTTATVALGQQAGGGAQWSLGFDGPYDTSLPENPGRDQLEPGAPVNFIAYAYHDGATPLTVTFPNPREAVDFWVADETGAYVAWVPAAAASPSMQLGGGQGGEVRAVWNQKDWLGRQLPRGIYSLEATVNTAKPLDLPVRFFQIGRVPPPPAGSFGSSMAVSTVRMRPGAWMEAKLVAYSMLADRSFMQFSEPWLPRKLDFRVKNAAGQEVFMWTAPVPKIMIFGPSFDYYEPFAAQDYGPVVWPSFDEATFRALPAGVYKLEMRLTGIPQVRSRTAYVQLTGTPMRQGIIELPQGTDHVSLRAAGSPTAPIVGSVWNGEPVAVVTDGVYWTKVQTKERTSGRLVMGWVRKGLVKSR